MTEQEMLAAARYVAQKQDELISANHRLFKAGKLAGAQQLTIDRQGAAISQALLLLEQAHQAAHQGSLVATLHYIAQAMEVLAND